MATRSYAHARSSRVVRSFLGVVSDAQTYKNLVYLALSFPLGVLYFSLLWTGLWVGVGTLVVAVGLPILVALLVLSDRVLVFERWLARRLLGRHVPLDRSDDPDDWTDYVRAPLTDAGTWAGLFYLGSKFFVGLLTTVLLLILFSMAGVLVLTPLYYDGANVGIHLTGPIELTLSYAVQFWDGVEVITLPVTITSWHVTTFWEALVFSGGGALLGLLTLHLCNALARVHGWYTEKLIRPRPMDV